MDNCCTGIFEPPEKSNYCEKNENIKKCERGYQKWSKVKNYPYPPCYKDQEYLGQYYNNNFHGEGEYKWYKNATYEGCFYSNFKEGYGSISLQDNSYFEGLFIKNQPFGPGVFTYANGRQDAGFWVGRKLVRLSRPIDFVVPRLAPTSAAKIKLLQFRRLIPVYEEILDSSTEILRKLNFSEEFCQNLYSNLISDPRSVFFKKLAYEEAFFTNVRNFYEHLSSLSNDFPDNGWHAAEMSDFEEDEESTTTNSVVVPIHCVCPDSQFVMQYKTDEAINICGEDGSEPEQLGILAYFTKCGNLNLEPGEACLSNESFKYEKKEDKGEQEERGEEDDMEQKKSNPLKLVSWNTSELCTEMLKQIFRYRAFEGKLNFKIAKLMLGARNAFKKTGSREKKCLQFLRCCATGPAFIIRELLCRNEISEELMDARGNSSIMFAAATDQHEIIELLLDYGVNVNTFNDESLTPLNLCLLRRLAEVNDVSKWEIAFLPKEITREMTDAHLNTSEWATKESIKNFDKIMGDGSSLDDTPNSLPSINPSPYKSDNKFSYENIEINRSTASIITMLKFLKSSSLTNAYPRQEESFLQCVIDKTAPKFSKSIFEKREKLKANDSYLFDLSPSEPGSSKKSLNTRIEHKASSTSEKGKLYSSDKITKIREIDKTIELLLKRGADPNISEVPKPSLHLAVFSKECDLVNLLLQYGANPNCQLHNNEGLLTPLHVIALAKPCREYVQICQLLLRYNASPEEETSTDFCIDNIEKPFLNNVQGRTPLQLLCMRQDYEYSLPIEYLIKIAVLLARVSNKKLHYNGHTYLTLAMLSGNTKLVRALLSTRLFNPNEILGQNLGTALHVLVSTPMQIKTPYETSVKMCDLLLRAGAEVLKKFKTPLVLKGTCIDYGFRQLEEEKHLRKDLVTSKTGGRDFIKDHTRILEYLIKKGERASKRHDSMDEKKKIFTEKRTKKIEKDVKGRIQWGDHGHSKKEVSYSGDESKTGSKKEKLKKKIKKKKEDESDHGSGRRGLEKVKKKRKGKRRRRMSDRESFYEEEEEEEEEEEIEKEKEKKGKKKKKLKEKDEDQDKDKKKKGKGKGKKKKKTDDIDSLFAEEQEEELEERKGKKRKKEKEGKKGKGKKMREKEREDEEEEEEGEEEGKKGKGKKGKGKKGKEKEEEEEGEEEGKKGKGKKGKKGKEKEEEEEGEEEGKKGKGKKGKGKKDKDKESEEEGEEEGKKGKGKKEKGKKDKEKEEKEVEEEGEEEGKKEKGKKGKGKKDKEKESEEEGEEEGKKGKGKKGKGKKDKEKEKESEEAGEEEGKKGKGKKGKGKKEGEKEEEEEEEVKKTRRKKDKKEGEEDDQGKEEIKKKGKKKEAEKEEYQEGMKKKKEKGDATLKEKEFISKKKKELDKILPGKDGKVPPTTKDGVLADGGEDKKDKPSQLEREKSDSNEVNTEKDMELTISSKKSRASQTLTKKYLPNLFSEMFPEKLRQYFLLVFGRCVKMDINKFLLPYVVLRDGNLYYRFQGKATAKKEQYSLI